MTQSTSAWVGYVGMAVAMVIGGAIAGSAGGVGYTAAYRIALDAAGACQGDATAYSHVNLTKVGVFCGVGAGVLASGLFCWGIIAAHRRRAGNKLIRRGAILGAVAGIVSALVVHTGLVIAVRTDPALPRIGTFTLAPLIAMGFGAFIGAALGVIGGRLADVPRTETAAEPRDATATALP